MPFVYRFLDIDDEMRTKYVGIIISESNFPSRFYQHLQEERFKGRRWKVQFFSVDSGSDAEAWEAHLIYVYGTREYLNKRKTKMWGRVNGFDEAKIRWITFVPDAIDVNPIELNFLTRDLVLEAASIACEIKSVSRWQEKVSGDIERLRSEISKMDALTATMSEIQIRSFLLYSVDNVSINECTAMEKVYWNYQKWCDICNIRPFIPFGTFYHALKAAAQSLGLYQYYPGLYIGDKVISGVSFKPLGDICNMFCQLRG